MSDAMTTGPAPYPVPALRVAATYHGSDGRLPEEIVLEFGGDGPVDPELVNRAVRALADVAVRRDYGYRDLAGAEAALDRAMRRAADANREAAHVVAAAQAEFATSGAAGAPLVDDRQDDLQKVEVTA